VSTWRVTDRDGGAWLDIVVKPRSTIEGIGPVKAERLCVSVNSPPVDGKANAAVIRVLADLFGVPKGAVSIVRGETGRKKTVRIGNCSAENVLRVVSAHLH
jgi:uncharacterized protein (TIGR00251 family)